jgi:hypothetical protein
MIRYSLKCAAGHGFESWFQNGDAFASLDSAGQLACPICGSATITKDLMAPAVRPARSAAVATTAASPPDATAKGLLSQPGSEVEAALAVLKKQIEDNSEYVGLNFVTEARKMHAGTTPERAIHGEAKPDEARKLIEDGVPVAPLPFLPGRKVN